VFPSSSCCTCRLFIFIVKFVNLLFFVCFATGYIHSGEKIKIFSSPEPAGRTVDGLTGARLHVPFTWLRHSRLSRTARFCIIYLQYCVGRSQFRRPGHGARRVCIWILRQAGIGETAGRVGSSRIWTIRLTRIELGIKRRARRNGTSGRPRDLPIICRLASRRCMVRALAARRWYYVVTV